MRASEYNASPPEYTRAQEYGAASKATRRTSSRQRALIQATAALMTVVTVAVSAPSITPKTAEAPAPVESAAEPVVETPEPASPAAPKTEPAAQALTAEERAFWDELAAACRSEDDAAIYALMHNALFVSLAERELWRLSDFADDPLRIDCERGTYGDARTVRYFFRDAPAAKHGGRVLYLNLITGSDGREQVFFHVITDESPADTQAITAARGYCKHGDILPGADYASLEQSEQYYEMTGEFAVGSVPEHEDMVFLENGTLVTGALTAYDGLSPLTFEVRGGYLQSGGQLTVENAGTDYVYLNHQFTLDGTEYGHGMEVYFKDDPFYHTPLQVPYLL